MAKKEKRDILDDLIEGARRLIKELDEIINPKKRQPVPVPIPVRPDHPTHHHRR